MPLRAVRALLFEQKNPIERLALCRISLGLILIVWVAAGPFDARFFTATAPLLYKPAGLFRLVPPLPHAVLLALKVVVVAAAVPFTLGAASRLASGVLSVAFFALNGYTAYFSPFWDNSTHLHFFLLLFILLDGDRAFSLRTARGRGGPAPSPRDRARASCALAFMQCFGGVIYLNAGLAKLFHGGLDWFTSGSTVYAAVVISGPYAHKGLGLFLTQWPALFPAITLATGAFELGFLFALLALGPRPALGVAALLFHAGVHATLDIPFFHLWAIYPALFILRNRGGQG